VFKLRIGTSVYHHSNGYSVESWNVELLPCLKLHMSHLEFLIASWVFRQLCPFFINFNFSAVLFSLSEFVYQHVLECLGIFELWSEAASDYVVRTNH